MLLFEQRRVVVGLGCREQSAGRASAEAGSPVGRLLLSPRVGDGGPLPAWQRREGKTDSRSCLLLESCQAA